MAADADERARKNNLLRNRLETLKGDMDSDMANVISKICGMAGMDILDALSDEDITELLRDAFNEFDKDNSGEMGVGEFTQAWSFLGLKGTPEEIADAFASVDTDNSV